MFPNARKSSKGFGTVKASVANSWMPGPCSPSSLCRLVALAHRDGQLFTPPDVHGCLSLPHPEGKQPGGSQRASKHETRQDAGTGQAPRRLWYIPAAVLGRSLPFVGFVPWEALVRVTCLPSTTEVRPALFASRPTHRGEAWPCLHALHVGMPARQHLGCCGRDDESSTTAWVVSCHPRTLLGWERSFACHTVSRFREPHQGRGCAVRVCPVRPVHGCPDGGSVRPSPWSSRPRSEAMRVAQSLLLFALRHRAVFPPLYIPS